MSDRFGHNALAPFDIWDDAREFLAEVIGNPDTPQEEVQRLLWESLLAGSDDWHYFIDCAKSLKQADCVRRNELDGHDVLTYMWYASRSPVSIVPPIAPWESTDRLIAQARELEQDAEAYLSILRAELNKTFIPTSKRPPTALAKRRLQSRTSHYWSNEQQPSQSSDSQLSVARTARPVNLPQSYRQPIRKKGSAALDRLDLRHEDQGRPDAADGPHGTSSTLVEKQPHASAILPTAAAASPTKSHYFNDEEPCPVERSSKRPPAGIVSSVPFPPLTQSSFGIIQEKLAHDPFWLLIAITFLIKTRGTQAIPTFYKVKERFPTPKHLADPDIKEELLGMIRHLGLSVVRVAYIQKYARAFLEIPPVAGVTYKVKTYSKNGTASRHVEPHGNPAGRDAAKAELRKSVEAWEIGHMTSGKYAIDSWRIFCRDELLGRARDWNGRGREPEFQPEWMRVMPDDKELRAYLRWMWMREGWEWDPATGERVVLRAEMQRAVEEGRVGYDNTGGLRILDDGIARQVHVRRSGDCPT